MKKIKIVRTYYEVITIDKEFYPRGSSGIQFESLETARNFYHKALLREKRSYDSEYLELSVVYEFENDDIESFVLEREKLR